MLRKSFLERSFASQGQLGQLRDSLKGREPAWPGQSPLKPSPVPTLLANLTIYISSAIPKLSGRFYQNFVVILEQEF